MHMQTMPSYLFPSDKILRGWTVEYKGKKRIRVESEWPETEIRRLLHDGILTRHGAPSPMNEPRHTPTPGKLCFGIQESGDIVIKSVTYKQVLAVMPKSMLYGEEYARFIVKAVNSHERLVEALRHANDLLGADDQCFYCDEEWQGEGHSIDCVVGQNNALLAEIEGE